ncbi:MAG: metallophosphoesterase [Ignavibacteria bacterium]
MVAVVGDVHGCFYTFLSLYYRIITKYPNIPVYCVGDLIDRGKHSFEVVQFFIDNNLKFTTGNHDYMLYSFVKEPDSLLAHSWVFNGNEATRQSYLNHSDAVSRHTDFIKSSSLYFNLDDCFISHAGVSEKFKKVLPPNLRENLHLLDQLIYSEFMGDSGVLWTRERLLNLGKLQIVGHSKQENVRIDSRSNSVYIDTGACFGNRLSSVIVHKNNIIEIMDEVINLMDI